jgi:hypothetical protein
MRRRSRSLASLLTLAATMIACHRGPRAGVERAACRAAEPRCEPGLVCMSDLCVRPPPADCAEVADTLVSLELGNYAARDDRAALAPTKRALCERARVSVDEATCLGKARDVWSAATCAPRLFPKVEATGCAPVIARIRTTIAGAVGSDPNAAPFVDKAIAVMATSCAEDHWPEEVLRCILDAPADHPEAMNPCEAKMPPGLREKLDARMKTIVP